MKNKVLILLMFTASCMPQKIIQDKLIDWGLKEKPALIEEPSLEEEYNLPKNPTIEEDGSFKMDERKKIFSLIDDFIENPSNDLRKIIMDLFPAFVQKSLSSTKIDLDMQSALNKINQQLFEKNREHYQLLFYFTNELSGENQMLAKQIFSRGFDFAPYTMLDLISFKESDPLCLIAKILPSQLEMEDKKDLFVSRYNSINSVREPAKKETRILSLLESCLATIKLELSQLSTQTPPVNPADSNNPTTP
jgi:hypothetical protein